LFTGLVEDIGTVRELRRHPRGARLAVACSLDGLRIGESVSVDGVCQTIVVVEGRTFSCDVLPETLRVSNIGFARPGTRVNLERAIEAGGRLGGHLMNGHADGLGTVIAVITRPVRLDVSVTPSLLKYIVPKGPVALNGVSLTVGPSVGNGRFSVFIIPETWERTNLKDLAVGSRVNIEVDIVAKYVERLCARKGGGV
jgi:riboflavin synthase